MRIARAFFCPAVFKNHLLMLRTGGTSPVCRAEHRSFYREQPGRGAAGMPHVRRGAQEEAVTGSPFLWLLSFRLHGCRR